MKWGQAFDCALDRKEIVNEDWNRLKLKDKIMYVTIQFPDKHSKNTKPYLMMHLGTYEGESPDSGWSFERFPWMPSRLDLFSENWRVK